MKQVPGFIMRHKVQVEPMVGVNSTGKVYGLSTDVKCHYIEKIQMVRNPQGEEVSSSSFYITTPDHRPTQDSRVTTPNGDVRKVVALDWYTWPGMNIPANSQVYLD